MNSLRHSGNSLFPCLFRSGGFWANTKCKNFVASIILYAIKAPVLGISTHFTIYHRKILLTAFSEFIVDLSVLDIENRSSERTRTIFACLHFGGIFAQTHPPFTQQKTLFILKRFFWEIIVQRDCSCIFSFSDFPTSLSSIFRKCFQMDGLRSGCTTFERLCLHESRKLRNFIDNSLWVRTKALSFLSSRR